MAAARPRSARRRAAALNGNPRLALELDQAAVRAGESVHGAVLLWLPAPGRARRVTVVAAGREVIGATAHYQPVVYQQPLPRPWGRIRSGSAKPDYELRRELAADVSLPAGRHVWPFTLTLPATATPTYGGLNAQVEHELVARVELADEPLQAWSPLHVWCAASAPRPASPGRLVAPGGESLADRLTSRWRGGLRLNLELDSAALDLREPLSGRYTISNPDDRPLRHLVLEVVGREQTRHLAATDVHEFIVARRELPVRAEATSGGEFQWVLPPTTGPTRAGRRWRVDWRLRATVSAAWRLGVSGELPLTLCDSGPVKELTAREEPRAMGEPEPVE